MKNSWLKILGKSILRVIVIIISALIAVIIIYPIYMSINYYLETRPDNICNKSVKSQIWDEEELELCLDKNNQFLFVDSNRAFKKIREVYSEDISRFQNEYSLKDFKNNWLAYIGNAVNVATEKSFELALQIYRNSYSEDALGRINEGIFG